MDTDDFSAKLQEFRTADRLSLEAMLPIIRSSLKATAACASEGCSEGGISQGSVCRRATHCVLEAESRTFVVNCENVGSEEYKRKANEFLTWLWLHAPDALTGLWDLIPTRLLYTTFVFPEWRTSTFQTWQVERDRLRAQAADAS